jgi:hypothetical protein
MLSEQAFIIRTERGLAIAGKRITLYDVMDYVTAQYSAKFIQLTQPKSMPQLSTAFFPQNSLARSHHS